MSITDRVFIRVFLGQELIEVFQSGETQIIIGLEGEAHLKLKGADVATVHALIEKRQDGYYICDLGSKSGTFKNGQQVLDDRIQSGDEIKIGGYRLEFSVGLPKAAAAPSMPTSAPKVEAPKVEMKKPEVKQETPNVHAITKPSSVVIGGAGTVESVQPYKQPTDLKGSYAPPSEIKNLGEYIKPSKGSVVEVTVAWNERILDTYHFDSVQTVTIGSNPKNTISIPIFDERVSHPLIKIDSQVRVLITPDMNGEVKVNETVTSINTLIIQGKLPREGAGYAIPLDQSNVIKVDLGSGVSVFIRFVAPTPKPIAAPFLLLATTELATLLVTSLFFGILGIYFAIYTPDIEEEEVVDQTPKKAAFIYDRPKRVEVVEETKSNSAAAETIKDQEKAKSRGEEGAAAAAMPNKSKSTEKKPTTPNAGTGKGVVKATTTAKAKPDSSAKSKAPDPTKTGIFSAFGSKGFNDQLSKTSSGAGSLGGLAGQATGTGGQAALGAGSTPGTGLKDIGAGGEGTATYGIAGVSTKGRGGGVSGYGTGGLGAKSRATVIAGGDGENIEGSIDREAIRKVIRDNQRVIQACYEKVLNKSPSLYGKLILKWAINENGRVSEARVGSSSLKNSEVENCILSRLRTWKFPEAPPGSLADVSFPFLFNAQ